MKEKIKRKFMEAALLTGIGVSTFAGVSAIVTYADTTISKTVDECSSSEVYLGDGLAHEIKSYGDIVYSGGAIRFSARDLETLVNASNRLMKRLQQ